MKLKFSSILAGGVMFSTSVEATDLSETPASTPKDIPEEQSSRDSSRLIKDVHLFNEAFDNPTLGGIPYEPYNMEKRK
jgi:hypothetical protein